MTDYDKFIYLLRAYISIDMNWRLFASEYEYYTFLHDINSADFKQFVKEIFMSFLNQ